MVEKGGVTISEDEAALYDRQIRLWGLDAQKRLRAARVLLIGMRGLGAEVGKNIVLAGIKALTLLDHTVVTEEDACSQFLIPRSDIGKNRAESSLERISQLNPMVEITADPSNIADKNEEFFKQFDVVCATCCTKSEMIRINAICHANNIQFFAGDVYGFYGFMFADLNEHEYAEDIPKHKHQPKDSHEPATKKVKTEEHEMVTVKKTVRFTRLKSAFDVNWQSDEMKSKIKKTPKTYFLLLALLKFRELHNRNPSPKLKQEDMAELSRLTETVVEEHNLNSNVIDQDFVQHCFAELSPVCAIVGGILGQEIIKAVSHKDAPHNNFFFFNGLEGSGMVDCIASGK